MYFQFILAYQFLEDNETKSNKIKELDEKIISKTFFLNCTSKENITKVIKYIRRGQYNPVYMKNQGNLETIYKKLKNSDKIKCRFNKYSDLIDRMCFETEYINNFHIEQLKNILNITCKQTCIAEVLKCFNRSTFLKDSIFVSEKEGLFLNEYEKRIAQCKTKEDIKKDKFLEIFSSTKLPKEKLDYFDALNSIQFPGFSSKNIDELAGILRSIHLKIGRLNSFNDEIKKIVKNQNDTIERDYVILYTYFITFLRICEDKADLHGKDWKEFILATNIFAAYAGSDKFDYYSNSEIIHMVHKHFKILEEIKKEIKMFKAYDFKIYN
ncbi:hypothetical protein EHP00_881 [Ecytonucleospora hepatopenaei]|uniref:Uncharacterized protein n=1 Tax=Ecytonucleospora hepatopenaei TaxID=646526 RepID=A0A1W0E3X2_9MICR|nr:hypothetical protein EHP00_881 [Ecytonucleospora hepatopenaei]